MSTETAKESTERSDPLLFHLWLLLFHKNDPEKPLDMIRTVYDRLNTLIQEIFPEVYLTPRSCQKWLNAESYCGILHSKDVHQEQKDSLNQYAGIYWDSSKNKDFISFKRELISRLILDQDTLERISLGNSVIKTYKSVRCYIQQKDLEEIAAFSNQRFNQQIDAKLREMGKRAVEQKKSKKLMSKDIQLHMPEYLLLIEKESETITNFVEMRNQLSELWKNRTKFLNRQKEKYSYDKMLEQFKVVAGYTPYEVCLYENAAQSAYAAWLYADKNNPDSNYMRIGTEWAAKALEMEEKVRTYLRQNGQAKNYFALTDDQMNKLKKWFPSVAPKPVPTFISSSTKVKISKDAYYYTNIFDSTSSINPQVDQTKIETMLLPFIFSGKRIILSPNQLIDNIYFIHLADRPEFRSLFQKGYITVSLYGNLQSLQDYIIQAFKNPNYTFSSLHDWNALLTDQNIRSAAGKYMQTQEEGMLLQTVDSKFKDRLTQMRDAIRYLDEAILLSPETLEKHRQKGAPAYIAEGVINTIETSNYFDNVLRDQICQNIRKKEMQFWTRSSLRDMFSDQFSVHADDLFRVADYQYNRILADRISRRQLFYYDGRTSNIVGESPDKDDCVYESFNLTKSLLQSENEYLSWDLIQHALNDMEAILAHSSDLTPDALIAQLQNHLGNVIRYTEGIGGLSVSSVKFKSSEDKKGSFSASDTADGPNRSELREKH